MSKFISFLSVKLVHLKTAPLPSSTSITEKRLFSELPAVMTQKAREELDKLEECVTECSVLYMPQVGSGDLQNILKNH